MIHSKLKHLDFHRETIKSFNNAWGIPPEDSGRHRCIYEAQRQNRREQTDLQGRLTESANF